MGRLKRWGKPRRVVVVVEGGEKGDGEEKEEVVQEQEQQVRGGGKTSTVGLGVGEKRRMWGMSRDVVKAEARTKKHFGMGRMRREKRQGVVREAVARTTKRHFGRR